MGTLFLILAALFLLSFVPLVFLFGRAYFRYRGTRVVNCPENGLSSKVRLDARKAAVSSIAGEPELRVGSCEHWPEREQCAQGCVSEPPAEPRKLHKIEQRGEPAA